MSLSMWVVRLRTLDSPPNLVRQADPCNYKPYIRFLVRSTLESCHKVASYRTSFSEGVLP
jgi:hypothetical protein